MTGVECVAVLSDVHGVLPALEVVLAEPDVRAADLVVVTGDHAAGPMPVETLDLLASLGPSGVLVRGNADDDLVAVARGEREPAPDIAVDGWAAAQLRPDQVGLLARLPHPVTLEVAGFGPVVFCHGTPRDLDEVVLVDTRMARWAEVFAELAPDVRTVVCGHTHMPFVRLVDRRLVVNSGSVGMPYGGAHPSWALLRDGAVTLRRSKLDLDAVCSRLAAQSSFSGVAQWAEEYVRSANSDAAAIEAFGPRDGRPG